LNASEVDALVNLYKTGASMTGLAQRFGMHFQTVRAHLRRRGVDLRSDHQALAADAQ
jgi:hypothetical protein